MPFYFSQPYRIQTESNLAPKYDVVFGLRRLGLVFPGSAVYYGDLMPGRPAYKVKIYPESLRLSTEHVCKGTDVFAETKLVATQLYPHGSETLA